jgi:hypothetical protein
MLMMAKPKPNGRKSATRSRLRVIAAAGVTGSPLSITTLRLKTRLPGVAAEARSSNTIG